MPGARSARLPISPGVAVATAVLVLLVVFAGGYGYHADELYFLAAGRHLAWAYPDQGPLTPAVAHAMDLLSPGSLTLLRVPSALMLAAAVTITGLMVRELGGGRRAEWIATLAVAASGVFLFASHLLSTTTFDLLAWTAITYLAVRAVLRGRPRLWLAAGALLGLALLNKPLVAFLAAALAGGVLIAGPRRLVREPWVWAGAVLALAMWSPWLVWQARHGWPQLEVSRNIATGGSTSSQPRWAFLPFQFLLAGPPLAPVWIAGLVVLFRDRRLRFLAWSWVLLAAVFLATGGKPYYMSGMLPLLFAAGAAPTERWLARGRRALRRTVFVAVFAVSAAISILISLPILPVANLGPVLAMNADVGSTVGWPEFARTVDAAASPGAVVLTESYGEAGALERYGHGRVYSGHNAYANWGTPPDTRGPVLVVGWYDRVWLEPRFSGCRLRARIRSPHGLDNDENGAPIWLCAAPRRPWSALWPSIRHLG